jgi:hypothetical protein
MEIELSNKQCDEDNTSENDPLVNTPLPNIDENNCPICLDDLNCDIESNSDVHTLSCNHKLHKTCLNELLEKGN